MKNARTALIALVAVAALGPAATGASADGGWTPPLDLQPLLTGSSTPPTVATAPGATTVAGWSTPAGDGSGRTVARVAVRLPGTGAPTTLDVTDTALGGSTVPVGIEADGTVFALVVSTDGQLRVWERPPGGAFSAAASLTDGSTSVTKPVLDVNAAGEAIAGWFESSSSNPVPHGAIRSGGTWSPAQVEGGGSGVPTIAVAIATTGRAVLAASANDGENSLSVAVREPGEPTLGAPTGLPGLGSVLGPGASVSVAPSGTAIIGTSVNGDGGPRVSVIPPGRGPTTAQPLTLAPSGDPKVAAGPGGAIVAWTENNKNVMVADVDPSTGIPGPSRLVSTAGQGAGSALAAVADPADGTAVLWGNSTTAALDVARRSAPGAAFAAPVELVPTGGDGGANTVAVDATATGDVTAVVSRPGAASSNAHPVLSAFDVTPPALAGPVFPARSVLGAPTAFTLAGVSDAWSTPSVAWAFGDGASATGASVTHAYATAGAFPAVLSATDGVGNVARVASTVPVPVPDADGDGVPATLDCNDHDPKIKPGATEIPGNKVDENCDGRVASYTSISLGSVLTWDRLRSGRTRITGLTVSNVQRGDVVRVTCSGRGCPKKGATKSLTLGKVKARRVSLSRDVRRTLSAKARIILTVARSGAITRRIRYTMVNHRNPTRSTRCLTPGSTKERVC